MLFPLSSEQHRTSVGNRLWTEFLLFIYIYIGTLKIRFIEGKKKKNKGWNFTSQDISQSTNYKSFS